MKDPFRKFVEHLITEFSKTDKSFEGLEAKDCIFRINRDVRFSKDKSPYKLYSSAVISSGGKKSRTLSGVYVELTPEHVRIYSGIYEPDKEAIYEIRNHISENSQRFRQLIEEPKFKDTFGEIRGEKNKVLPAEFKSSAELQPLLFNKQWYYFSAYSADVITSPELDEIVLNCFQIAKPVTDFLIESIN